MQHFHLNVFLNKHYALLLITKNKMRDVMGCSHPYPMPGINTVSASCLAGAGKINTCKHSHAESDPHARRKRIQSPGDRQKQTDQTGISCSRSLIKVSFYLIGRFCILNQRNLGYILFRQNSSRCILQGLCFVMVQELLGRNLQSSEDVTERSNRPCSCFNFLYSQNQEVFLY